MNAGLRNTLAIILGIIVGSIVNIGLINVGGHLVPPPEGTNVDTMEGLQQALPFFEPKHFLFPFLAHALGTFVGSSLAARFGASHYMKLALAVSAFFLMGGIANIFLLPGPFWFNASDVILAYLPMGYLGGRWFGNG